MTTPRDILHRTRREWAQGGTDRPTVASSEGEELFVPCDVPVRGGEGQDAVTHEPQEREDTEARG